MPSSSDFRDAIRESSLSEPIWDWLGYEVKIVFLIGRPGKIDLTREIQLHDDLLVLDFDESQYYLGYKDIAFFKYVKRACFSADFVFIGDDDILIVPQNLAREIQRIKSEPQTQAVGCLKPEEYVTRTPKNKYFVPRQLYFPETYPQYFSGGGYVTSLHFALKMEEQINRNFVLPMEDTFVGTLINAAKMSKYMGNSVSICMGLRNWFKTEIEINKDVCIMRGLTLSHKFYDPEEMRRSFQSVVSGNFVCGERSFKQEDYLSAWKRNNDNFELFNFEPFIQKHNL